MIKCLQQSWLPRKHVNVFRKEGSGCDRRLRRRRAIVGLSSICLLCLSVAARGASNDLLCYVTCSNSIGGNVSRVIFTSKLTCSSTSGSLVYAVTQCYMQVQQKIAGADLPTNVVISGGAGVLAAFEGKNIAFETNVVGWRLSSDATAPNQVIPGGIGDFLSVLISQTNDWPKKLLRMPIAPQDARVLRTIDGYQARIVTLRTGPVSPMSEFCVFDLTANRKVYSRVLCSTTISYGVDSERVVSVSIIEAVLQKEGFIGSPDILAGE